MKRYEIFIVKYLALADEYSHSNELMNIGGMLTLLGQCKRDLHLKIRGSEFDCRFHCLCIQRSGTGKAPASWFLTKLANEVGLEAETLSSLTSAGLIGTIKSGETIYGSAFDKDIIIIQEAGILFNDSETSRDLRYQINQIIDKDGIINKRLATGNISYKSKSSLFLTTHPPNFKLRTKIESGFLPRFLLCFRDVDEDVYMEISDWMVRNIGKNSEENDFAYIVNQLKELRITPDEVSFEENVFQSAVNEMKKIREEYSPETQDLSTPYLIRFLTQIMKLSAIFACFNGGVVDENCVRKSTDVLLIFWKSILSYIEKEKKSEKEKEIERIEKRIEHLFNRFGDELSSTKIMQYTKMYVDQIEPIIDIIAKRGKIKKIKKQRGFLVRR